MTCTWYEIIKDIIYNSTMFNLECGVWSKLISWVKGIYKP